MPSPASEIPIEIRQEWTRLRAILYEPSSVWLASWTASERWLTDQYVMLDVTDSPAFEESARAESELSDPSTSDEYIPDGSYKLVASKGFEPKALGWEPDLDVYFAAMDQLADWLPAQPTEWSVAEHPGKAQLWTYKIAGEYQDEPRPCLLGESTWTAIKRNHPDAVVEYSQEINVFRFTDDKRVFCFAAGIRIPTGQGGAAQAIAWAVP